MKKIIVLSLITLVSTVIQGAQTSLQKDITLYEDIAGSGDFWSQAKNLSKNPLIKSRKTAIDYLAEQLKKSRKTADELLVEGIDQEDFNPFGLEILINFGAANVNIQDVDGNTPLMKASQAGKNEIIKLLLQNGAHIDTRNNINGRTALMFAFIYDNDEAVTLLLQNGANFDLQDNLGKTALEYASEKGEKHGR